MTLLLLLAACGRSPAPESTDTEAAPQSRSFEVRDPDAVSRTVSISEYWFDGDRDGFGAPGTKLWATEQPRRYVPVGGDCNDRDAAVNPDAVEVEADGLDNDCDGTTDEVEADTGDTSGTDTASTDTATDSGGTDSGAADTASADSGTDSADSGSDSGLGTAVVSTGILVSRDTTDGLTYPATIYAWYGSSTTASMEVTSAGEMLNFAPSDADLSSHSWVDIQASWSSGANWSDDCSGFSVSSADYTVALYEKSGTGTSDTCRIYVGLAVPTGSDVGVWTLVP